MAPSPRRQPLRAAPRFTAPGDAVPGDPPAERSWDDAEPTDAEVAAARGEARCTERAAPVAVEPAARRRSVLLGLAVGLAVTVAAVAIAFSIVAIPLFALASIDPGSGLDRDLVRTGLFWVALPFGAVAGLASGVAVGIWYGRGGRLPAPDRIHER